MTLYRLLTTGEPIQPGDECLMDDCETWRHVEGWVVGGKHNPAVMVPMRRRMDRDVTPRMEGRGER